MLQAAARCVENQWFLKVVADIYDALIVVGGNTLAAGPSACHYELG